MTTNRKNARDPLGRRPGVQMRRRDLPLIVTAVMVGGRPVRAQQKAMPVIGQLSPFSPPANLGNLVRGPIHKAMSEMGFVEGQNMIWEYRWAEGHYDRLPVLAADLVSRKVDLIVANGGAPPALAAKNETPTIPIVFTDVGDPVGYGLVAVSPGQAATSPASVTSMSSYSPSGSSCFASWSLRPA
jgi:putative ABC transport system substrate-binding protein